ATSRTSSRSLHDALPIFAAVTLWLLGGQRSATNAALAPTDDLAAMTVTLDHAEAPPAPVRTAEASGRAEPRAAAAIARASARGSDRKSTRLNSSHVKISY